MNKLSRLFLFVFVFYSPFSFSGENSYQCIVLNDAFVEGDGKISIKPKSLNIGKKFAIDRKTGVLIGDVFFTFGEPKVIARGSKDNSFKVIWMKESGGKDGMFLDYLSIDEYISGTKKPFSYFTGSQLSTGLCE